MAYFSKDAYERKREYAAGVAINSIEILAEVTGKDTEDLEVVAEASRLRHKIHSTDCHEFENGLIRYDMNRIGNQYSVDITLADEIDALGLIAVPFPRIEEPEICDEDSSEDIFEYCGEPVPEDVDEDELRNLALENLTLCWDDRINSWSAAVRQWFKELNKTYGTHFPD